MRSILVPLSAMLLLASCSKSDDNCPDAQLRKKHKNDMCTMEIQPICGCDGKTYTNQCEALRQGITVKSQGPCP